MTDPILEAAEMTVPGLGEAKAAFTLAKALWPLLAALGAAGAVGAALLYIHHLQADANQARAERDQARAEALKQGKQSDVAGDAAKILDAGRAKADVTVHIQQEHHDAILAAPGAGQALDPGLYSAFLRSLCTWPSAADDPRCAEMRAADSRQLPPAGAVGAPAGPYGWGDRGVRGQPDGET